MGRFKKWMVEKFLPAYAREELQEQINALNLQVEKLVKEKEQLSAYIDGLEFVVERMRRR